MNKIFKYIHDNLLDVHMIINIMINIGLISALLGIFFFTYASIVEESIVKANASIGVTNIMEAISPLLNNNIKQKIKTDLKVPDLDKEDIEAKNKNNILMNDAFSKLLIILDIGLTGGFILCTIYKHSFKHVLLLNLIITALVGCTEYIFLSFIPANFISVDTNFIRYTILTTLKSKILINNAPIG